MKEKDLMIKLINIGKVIIGLLAVILVVLIVGVSKIYSNNKVDTSNNSTQESESEYNTNYDVSMFKKINASDLKDETKGKLRVVYIGRETCGWCAAFLPNLWTAQEDYEFETLYIDIAEIIDFSNGNIINQDEYDNLASLTGKDYENYMEENLGATPMILIMKDNKIVGAQTGYSEYKNFETILNNAGIKK